MNAWKTLNTSSKFKISYILFQKWWQTYQFIFIQADNTKCEFPFANSSWCWEEESAFMNLHPWPSFGSLGWSTTPWALWEGTEKGLGRERRGPWPPVSMSLGGMGFMEPFILEYQVNPGKNQGFSCRQRILADLWIFRLEGQISRMFKQ